MKIIKGDSDMPNDYKNGNKKTNNKEEVILHSLQVSPFTLDDIFNESKNSNQINETEVRDRDTRQRNIALLNSLPTEPKAK